ncbi:restriction endonuclease [Myxococcota bacterium]|nr:restriction endonuclease [Myxococcota bacterium]
MSVLILFFGGIGLGFLLILLIAVTSPKPAPVDLRAESNNSPLVELDAEELGKLVVAILEKMGLEIERITGGANEIIEIRALNPTPITGGTFFVHCLPAPPTGRIDGPMVGRFIRAMRSAYVSKGLLFTTGTFTPDGRLAADDAPVELFDRDQILKLVDQYFGDEGESLPKLVAKLPGVGGVAE